MHKATLNERKFPYLILVIAKPTENKLFNNQFLVDMYSKVVDIQKAIFKT